MEGTTVLPYQQLFELDELLVEILRHLLEDKKSINELLQTAKWLSKRLHSTALWTSLGFLFYKHNEINITPKMLWHLLRERQIELTVQSYPKETMYSEENAYNLKYLIHLARSEKEAHQMVALGFLQSPLYKTIQLHRNPELQELVCILLSKLCKNMGAYLQDMYDYMPVLVDIIKSKEACLDQSSLALAACKALGVFASNAISDLEIFPYLSRLGPILVKLMTHQDSDLQAAGYSITGSAIATGDFTNYTALANLPAFWAAITDGLSNKLASIRRDVAWTCSNLAIEDAGHMTSDEIFQKLLALKNDSTEITREVVWVFANLANSYHQLNVAQKQVWERNYIELLDFCCAQLKLAIQEQQQPRNPNEGPVAILYETAALINQLIGPLLTTVNVLLNVLEDWSNKEMVFFCKQNPIHRELYRIVHSPSMPKSMILDIVRDSFTRSFKNFI